MHIRVNKASFENTKTGFEIPETSADISKTYKLFGQLAMFLINSIAKVQIGPK